MRVNMNKKQIEEKLTFDDVLLVPQKSEVIPKEVDTKTLLSKSIKLNIPIISASMDTVTEHEMAISMAKYGGLGIIHKNLSIKDQANEVKKVKRFESGVISDPIIITKNISIKRAKEIMTNNYINGLPVVENNSKKLIGIVTNRDIKYSVNEDLPIESLMTKKENLITSKKNINLAKAKEILHKNKIEKLPIVDNSFNIIGLISSKDIDNLVDYPLSSKDKNGALLVGAAVGVSNNLDRVKALIEAGADVICVDSAHGHTRSIINFVKLIRKSFPKIDIIAGNIVTLEAARDLYNAGANILKVGIGPGSICTTRIIAGVGVPQISAIFDVYEFTKNNNISIIADGGITTSGSIVKALAAGASAVMIGGLIAGCDEAPGEEITLDNKKYKVYRGMGSIASMGRGEHGSSDRYFQSNTPKEKLVPEGIEARVAYKGNLKNVLFQLIGGLKSGMGYCGAKDITSLVENAKFIKITNSGIKESHPHDVTILREAPNYSPY